MASLSSSSRGLLLGLYPRPFGLAYQSLAERCSPLVDGLNSDEQHETRIYPHNNQSRPSDVR